MLQSNKVDGFFIPLVYNLGRYLKSEVMAKQHTSLQLPYINKEELQTRKEHTAISEKRASLIRCYCLFGYLLEVNYCAKYLTAHRNYPYNNHT